MGFGESKEVFLHLSSTIANLATFIILISVCSVALLNYLNFVKQFRNKSLNKRTYHFVDVLLQNLELFKRNIFSMLHNCCGSLLLCFKFSNLFKDRCLPNWSTFWGIQCREIFHSPEFVLINSRRLFIPLLFFSTMFLTMKENRISVKSSP